MIHKSDKIKFILKRQFPDALIGSEMSFLGEAETRVYGELSNLPLEELDKQYREQKELHAAEMAARQRRDDQASFFNMPSAAADFEKQRHFLPERHSSRNKSPPATALLCRDSRPTPESLLTPEPLRNLPGTYRLKTA